MFIEVEKFLVQFVYNFAKNEIIKISLSIFKSVQFGPLRMIPASTTPLVLPKMGLIGIGWFLKDLEWERKSNASYKVLLS